jgi:hypothetical protein
MALPSPPTIRLEQPDSTFRLTPEERANVRTGFDVDALERLMAAVVPEGRPMLLEAFQRPSSWPIRFVVQMGDPSLQPLLDEVWAPMWMELGPDAIDVETAPYPGRELARQRRDQAADAGKPRR